MPIAAALVQTHQPDLASVKPKVPAGATVVPDGHAKDAMITWYRGEFAAANAIIDALCSHLRQITGNGGGSGGGRDSSVTSPGSEYEAAFTAIHRRRLNWIPVLQMQKYHSIAEVAIELDKVAARKAEERKHDEEVNDCSDGEKTRSFTEKVKEIEDDSSPDSDITDTGSHEAPHSTETIQICANHGDCDGRSSNIKPIKGFQAKEQVKGHMVNVVKGLKLFEDLFTEHELSNLAEFVNELRTSGQKGELSGETFILFNKQMKGNKRELIQLGVPIFGHVKDEHTGNNQKVNIEPIPALLQSLIDHLITWKLIPEYKKPNGCVINYFEEDEYSPPFLKPPHLEQPISTLVLSESTMAFGRTLASDNDGNFRGQLSLSLKQGSLLVMRGNSADMARHVMCPSPNKRVSITFFRVRPEANQIQSPPTSPHAGGVMTLWQPGTYPMQTNPTFMNGYDPMQKWGIVQAPMVMLAAPVQPMVVNNGGTGVFLPCNVGSRKHARHLPPRAQKRRFLSLPAAPASETASESGISVGGA